MSIRIAFYVKGILRFQVSEDVISLSDLESWWARNCESAFSWDISRNSNSSSIFKGEFLSGCELHFHTTTEILHWRVYGFFPTLIESRSPSTTFLKIRFLFLNSLVCSIYHFCVASTENIAVRLCFCPFRRFNVHPRGALDTIMGSIYFYTPFLQVLIALTDIFLAHPLFLLPTYSRNFCHFSQLN